MVPFAGFSMPLQYGSVGQGTYALNQIEPHLIFLISPVASHAHVRESAGLFDVSHMVQSL